MSRLPPTDRQHLRARLELKIEELIALLDEIDGDPDFEEDHEGEADDNGIADMGGMEDQYFKVRGALI